MPDRTTGRQEQGFTVLEALISLTLFLFVMTVIVMTYEPSRRIYKKGEHLADIQQNARLAMAEMVRQIRMAGYFPENFAPVPANPLLADPIRVATDGAVGVYGDLDDSGTSQLYLYCLDGTVLRRTRAEVDESDAYDCSQGDVMAERVVDLRFTYYDENNNPLPDPPTEPYELDDQSAGAIPDMTDTAERAAIRRIVVALTARADTAVGEAQLFSVNSDIVLRNVR